MSLYGKHVNIHKVGDFLALDERTGKEMWRSELDIDWDGTLADKTRLDHKHPDFEKKSLPYEKMPYRTSPPVNETVTVTANTSATPSNVEYQPDSPVSFLFGP